MTPAESQREKRNLVGGPRHRPYSWKGSRTCHHAPTEERPGYSSQGCFFQFSDAVGFKRLLEGPQVKLAQSKGTGAFPLEGESVSCHSPMGPRTLVNRQELHLRGCRGPHASTRQEAHGCGLESGAQEASYLENSRKHLGMGFRKSWDFWMGGRNQELVGVQYSWGRDLPQLRAAGARGADTWGTWAGRPVTRASSSP